MSLLVAGCDGFPVNFDSPSSSESANPSSSEVDPEPPSPLQAALSYLKDYKYIKASYKDAYQQDIYLDGDTIIDNNDNSFITVYKVSNHELHAYSAQAVAPFFIEYGYIDVNDNYKNNFLSFFARYMASKYDLYTLLKDNDNYTVTNDVYKFTNIETEYDFYSYMESDASNIYPEFNDGVKFNIVSINLTIKNEKITHLDVTIPYIYPDTDNMMQFDYDEPFDISFDITYLNEYHLDIPYNSYTYKEYVIEGGLESDIPNFSSYIDEANNRILKTYADGSVSYKLGTEELTGTYVGTDQEIEITLSNDKHITLASTGYYETTVNEVMYDEGGVRLIVTYDYALNLGVE